MNEATGSTELDVDEPFTRRQFVAAGRVASALRQRASAGYVQLMTGVWVRARSVDHLLILRAALLIHPLTAYASYVSAARVLGLPVPDSAFAHVTVTRHRDRRFRPQIKCHVTDRRQSVVVVDGIRTTDAIATFIDCAGMLGLVDLVVLGDAIVRKCQVRPEDLVRACERSTDYYAKLALVAASYVRQGVDSPMKTRLRMLIVLAGVPEPVVNYRIWNDDGTWRRRFDLCFPSVKLVIEYDGVHHADPAQWEKDLERREEFDDEGYRVLVVTAPGIFRHPERTLLRIRRQLVLRGMPAVPEIDPRWREYFAT